MGFTDCSLEAPGFVRLVTSESMRFDNKNSRTAIKVMFPAQIKYFRRGNF